MLYKSIHLIRTYWIVVLIGTILTGMLWFISNQGDAITKLESDVKVTEGLLVEAEKTLAGLNREFDAKAHQKEINARTVSARKIGKDMIAVDDALTAFYKTNAPLPEDKNQRDALYKNLEAVKKKNTELTGAGEADHIKTWKLNPEWKLKLESIITYQDTDRVPIVFSMTTKVGKSAGLVYAVYDVTNHRLQNVTRHYTTVGLQDEVDVGGI
ncbi:hypothetical protein [Metabacillus sp. SLBN-84]